MHKANNERMGVRYLTLAKDPRLDPLRPKNFDNNIQDHLVCPKPIYNEFKEAFLEKKTEKNEFCCKNCCLYVVFNLLSYNQQGNNISSCIELFKNKKLYFIYIAKKSESNLTGKIKEANPYGVILEEKIIEN